MESVVDAQLDAFRHTPVSEADYVAGLSVHKLMSRLSERERGVLWRHYWYGETYLEIGVRLGVGKERVRQILCAALRKCRRAGCVKPKPVVHDLAGIDPGRDTALWIKVRNTQELSEVKANSCISS